MKAHAFHWGAGNEIVVDVLVPYHCLLRSYPTFTFLSPPAFLMHAGIKPCGYFGNHAFDGRVPTVKL